MLNDIWMMVLKWTGIVWGCLIFTDSGVCKWMGNTLWITVLFPLEDGAGDQLHFELKGQKGMENLTVMTTKRTRLPFNVAYLCFLLRCDSSHIFPHHKTVVKLTQHLWCLMKNEISSSPQSQDKSCIQSVLHLSWLVVITIYCYVEIKKSIHSLATLLSAPYTTQCI